MRDTIRTTLILGGAILFSGCYKYVPIADVPVPGEDVRVRLTSGAALEREQSTGILTRELEGEAVGTDNGTFILEVPTARAVSEFQANFLFKNTVELDHADIESYELRTLDRAKTFGLVAGAAVLTGVLITRALSGAGNEGPPNLGEGQNPNVDGISLIRIPIGW